MHYICNVTFDLGLFKKFTIALCSLYNVNSHVSKYSLLCSQAKPFKRQSHKVVKHT